MANEPPPAVPGRGVADRWYESNNSVGLAARVGQGWLAGATYSVFVGPEGIPQASHELAFAARYVGAGPLGTLRPQAKLAVPIAGSDGLFTQLVLHAPELALFGGGDHPVNVNASAELGLGVADYYGAGSDATGYAAFGVVASTPLPTVSSSRGAWTLSVGGQVLVRAEGLREVEPALADDVLVPEVAVGLSFVY